MPDSTIVDEEYYRVKLDFSNQQFIGQSDMEQLFTWMYDLWTEGSRTITNNHNTFIRSCFHVVNILNEKKDLTKQELWLIGVVAMHVEDFDVAISAEDLDFAGVPRFFEDWSREYNIMIKHVDGEFDDDTSACEFGSDTDETDGPMSADEVRKACNIWHEFLVYTPYNSCINRYKRRITFRNKEESISLMCNPETYG
jgi:hypothetical protein